MAWRQPEDKPLSEPMMVSLLTRICVTRAQWVKNDVYKHSMFALLVIDLRSAQVYCVAIFFDMLTPVPFYHFFSSLILLFIYV